MANHFPYNANGRLTSFNEQFFAEVYHRTYSPVYLVNKKHFRMYNEENGLWESQSSPVMLNKPRSFLFEFAKAYKVPAIETKRTCGVLRSIRAFLEGITEQNNFFSPSDKNFIHCADGVLEIDLPDKPNSKSFSNLNHCHDADELDLSTQWELKLVPPDYRILSRCELKYDPQEKYPKLEAFLHLLNCLSDPIAIHKFVRNISAHVLKRIFLWAKPY